MSDSNNIPRKKNCTGFALDIMRKYLKIGD
jgi:hypothetical protein